MSTEKDGRHDFDFFVGDWEEFQSTVTDRSIMGGMGNLEDMFLERGTGRAYGTLLSIFYPPTGQWSQYWVDSTNAVLQDPMVGKFMDGVGEFFSEDEFEGRPVLARAIWSHITETSCRGEQALSDDEAKTWETNWIMEVERV